MIELIWVTFKVEVSDSQYHYGSQKEGSGELTAQVPRSVLENLNAANLLNGLLASALIQYDAPKEKEIENEH